MKKVMMGVGLGLAAASQANAWTGGIEDMRTMQANKSGPMVKVKSSRVECCRLRPGHAHGHAHQTKRIHNGRTYYCSDVTAQHMAPHKTAHHGHHFSKKHFIKQPRIRPQYQQQALQAQRAKREAMFAAQAKRKAQLLAQQRKRAALLEQQKRRKIQLAQQQQRAAHQAAMLAAKKRRAALLIQQKRRAMQLAQQQRQQAQKRAQLLAQQKHRAAQQRMFNQQPCHCGPAVRKPASVAQHKRRVIQPRVNYRQQVITQQHVVKNFVPKEEVISRRIITTHVKPSQMHAPARTVVRPRISASQRMMQQSVDHHDRQHSDSHSGWQQMVQPVEAVQQVQYIQPAQSRWVTVAPPAPVVKHEAHKARLRQQRLQQIRAAQIAAQHKRQQQVVRRQITTVAPPVKMAPIAPYVAPAYVVEKPSYSGSSSYTGSYNNGGHEHSGNRHSGGWQRGAAVKPHHMGRRIGSGTGYEMYQG